MAGAASRGNTKHLSGGRGGQHRHGHWHKSCDRGVNADGFGLADVPITLGPGGSCTIDGQNET
jgi:hypothetical protein